MSAAPDDGIGYVRGGAVEIDGRRAARAVVVACIAALAAVVIVLTVVAVDHNARIDRLRDHGVAVDATVTGCVAQASGTGATVDGYTCRATFPLGGHLYHEVLGGTTTLHAAGTVIPAVVDPDRPADVSTAGAVAATHASWTAFIAPAVPLVVLVAVVALVVRRRRRA